MIQKNINRDSKKSFYPQTPHEDEQDNWQVSYLDVITILLGFLVILLALSQFTERQLPELAELFGTDSGETDFIGTPVGEIKEEIEFHLADQIEQNQIIIDRDLNDLRIRFSSDELYRLGSAKLLPAAEELLSEVINGIKLTSFSNFHIDVEGHTDNVPISSGTYPSNWELSTARAANVVKYIADTGFESNRLKASGFADSRPRVPNMDSQGNPIPENQNLNRRVVLRIYYSANETGEVPQVISTTD